MTEHEERWLEIHKLRAAGFQTEQIAKNLGISPREVLRILLVGREHAEPAPPPGLRPENTEKWLKARELRKHGISLKGIGTALGVSAPTVSRWTRDL